jgi:hypothetical protein
VCCYCGNGEFCIRVPLTVLRNQRQIAGRRRVLEPVDDLCVAAAAAVVVGERERERESTYCV